MARSAKRDARVIAIIPGDVGSVLLVALRMMTSAGLLAYRYRDGGLEVFIVHPGGPFYRRKDDGFWSIPKGQFQADEDPLDAARREFTEETSFPADGEFIALGSAKQRSGKVVSAWAFATDFDASKLTSNLFAMEWPPRAGKMQSFPEVDRGEWFTLDGAKRKLLPGQVVFLDRLLGALGKETAG